MSAEWQGVKSAGNEGTQTRQRSTFRSSSADRDATTCASCQRILGQPARARWVSFRSIVRGGLPKRTAYLGIS